MTNRPSYAQLEGLAEFLEQNPGIAKGLLRTTQAKLETKRKWAALATSLNSLGGAIKDSQGWAKYWAEKKCALKKHCAQLSASIRSTGAGVPTNLPMLSEIDQRLVAVMGGQDFANRNAGLAVDPFPEPVALSTDSELINVNLEVQRTSPTPGTSRDYAVHGTQTPVFRDAVQETPTIPSPRSTPLQQSTMQRRRRRSSIRRPPGDMEEFRRIEERRVEAEVNTSRALAHQSEQITNVAVAITRQSEEMANVAAALTQIANALVELTRVLSRPNQ